MGYTYLKEWLKSRGHGIRKDSERYKIISEDFQKIPFSIPEIVNISIASYLDEENFGNYYVDFEEEFIYVMKERSSSGFLSNSSLRDEYLLNDEGSRIIDMTYNESEKKYSTYENLLTRERAKSKIKRYSKDIDKLLEAMEFDNVDSDARNEDISEYISNLRKKLYNGIE